VPYLNNGRYSSLICSSTVSHFSPILTILFHLIHALLIPRHTDIANLASVRYALIDPESIELTKVGNQFLVSISNIVDIEAGEIDHVLGHPTDIMDGPDWQLAKQIFECKSLSFQTAEYTGKVRVAPGFPYHLLTMATIISNIGDDEEVTDDMVVDDAEEIQTDIVAPSQPQIAQFSESNHLETVTTTMSEDLTLKELGQDIANDIIAIYAHETANSPSSMVAAAAPPPPPVAAAATKMSSLDGKSSTPEGVESEISENHMSQLSNHQSSSMGASSRSMQLSQEHSPHRMDSMKAGSVANGETQNGHWDTSTLSNGELLTQAPLITSVLNHMDEDTLDNELTDDEHSELVTDHQPQPDNSLELGESASNQMNHEDMLTSSPSNAESSFHKGHLLDLSDVTCSSSSTSDILLNSPDATKYRGAVRRRFDPKTRKSIVKTEIAGEIIDHSPLEIGDSHPGNVENTSISPLGMVRVKDEEIDELPFSEPMAPTPPELTPSSNSYQSHKHVHRDRSEHKSSHKHESLSSKSDRSKSRKFHSEPTHKDSRSSSKRKHSRRVYESPSESDSDNDSFPNGSSDNSSDSDDFDPHRTSNVYFPSPKERRRASLSRRKSSSAKKAKEAEKKRFSNKKLVLPGSPPGTKATFGGLTSLLLGKQKR
jgi:hypothetical protein